MFHTFFFLLKYDICVQCLRGWDWLEQVKSCREKCLFQMVPDLVKREHLKLNFPINLIITTKCSQGTIYTELCYRENHFKNINFMCVTKNLKFKKSSVFRLVNIIVLIFLYPNISSLKASATFKVTRRGAKQTWQILVSHV